MSLVNKKTASNRLNKKTVAKNARTSKAIVYGSLKRTPKRKKLKVECSKIWSPNNWKII